MSYRCGKCKEQIKQKTTQFKIFEKIGTNPGSRTLTEKGVCYKCWKRDDERKNS